MNFDIPSGPSEVGINKDEVPYLGLRLYIEYSNVISFDSTKYRFKTSLTTTSLALSLKSASEAASLANMKQNISTGKSPIPRVT